MANNQLMLQQLFSGRPLWGVEHATRTGERGVWGGGGHRCLSVQDSSYKTGLLVETGLHKLLERFAVVALQRGRVVLWDEE